MAIGLDDHARGGDPLEEQVVLRPLGAEQLLVVVGNQLHLLVDENRLVPVEVLQHIVAAGDTGYRCTPDRQDVRSARQNRPGAIASP